MVTFIWGPPQCVSSASLTSPSTLSLLLSPVLGLLGHVPLHVQGQVVGPGEAPLAHPALERLGPGVLPVVPGQFVGPSEAPLAVREVASVRLFT